MRHILAGLLALALVTAAGCGGSSDDSSDCGDVGRKVASCTEESAAEIQAYCEATLEELDCETRSEQDVLDCIMGASCAELEDGPPESCMEGCTLPPTVR